MRRLAIGLVLLALGCAEQFEDRFETGAEARISDLARRGWVPEWLPADARNVHVQHDIDTNEVWLRFELDEMQRSALVVGLPSLSATEIEAITIRAPRRVDRVVLVERAGSTVFVYVGGQ